MRLAVDMSRWGGDLTAQEAYGLQQEWISTVILATGPGGYSTNFHVQADDAVAAGLRLEVYIFLEWTGHPKAWVREGLQAIADYRDLVERIWIDVEDTQHPVPVDWMDQLTAALDEAELWGKPVGIYTGRWYWVGHLGNSQEFAERQLWNSWYDNDPDIDGLPYGGWTRESVTIEQYTGTTIIAGQSVDSNAIYIEPEGENNLDPFLRETVKAMTGADPADPTKHAYIQGVFDRFNKNEDGSDSGDSMIVGYLDILYPHIEQAAGDGVPDHQHTDGKSGPVER